MQLSGTSFRLSVSIFPKPTSPFQNALPAKTIGLKPTPGASSRSTAASSISVLRPDTRSPHPTMSIKPGTFTFATPVPIGKTSAGTPSVTQSTTAPPKEDHANAPSSRTGIPKPLNHTNANSKRLLPPGSGLTPPLASLLVTSNAWTQIPTSSFPSENSSLV